jgi:predicted Zn-dependent protease
MKKLYVLFLFTLIVLIFSGCHSNPLTGRRNMAFISNSQLFPMAFTEYNDFLRENTIVTNTPDALMVTRVGERLAEAAQKLLAAEGHPDYLKDYRWEFTLVQDDAINAWAMPGGKIVFYTGILPITQNEAGIAVVMGHEIAHAILNHGQQRMSAGILQQIGALGVSIATANQSPEAQALIMAAFGITSNLAGTLPFSRQHEKEADEYGLILMAIAGYNPDEGAAFWERMSRAGGGSVPEFLSTHPSDASRIRHMRNFSPEAKRRAARFGVTF